MLKFSPTDYKIKKVVRGDETMYLVKVNDGKQLCGGIIIDVDAIAEMYKNETLEKFGLSGVLKKVNCSDIIRMEKVNKYLMKTVDVYCDRGQRVKDINISLVNHDARMKITYEICCDENNNTCDKYTLNITGFEIESVRNRRATLKDKVCLNPIKRCIKC